MEPSNSRSTGVSTIADSEIARRHQLLGHVLGSDAESPPAAPGSAGSTVVVPDSEIKRGFQSHLRRQRDRDAAAASGGAASLLHPRQQAEPDIITTRAAPPTTVVPASLLDPAALSTALANLSLASLPAARIVLHHDSIPAPAVRLGSDVNGKSAFGVVQPTDAASTQLDIFVSGGVQLKLSILYDPARDSCLLKNEGESLVFTEHKDHGRTHLRSEGITSISPGFWSILILAADSESPVHVLDLLLFHRKFILERTQKPKPMLSGAASGKRRAAGDDSSNDAAGPAKRTKITIDNGTPRTNDEIRIILPPTPTVLEENNQTQSLRKSIITTLVDMEAGDVITVRTATNHPALAPAPFTMHHDSYSLTSNKPIANTKSARLFTVNHSHLPIEIVAKIIKYREHTRSNLLQCSSTWATEHNFLSQIKHDNIISLETADSRLFVLYLEHLPSSIQSRHRSSFKPADALNILCDISSALSYLCSRGFAHNDVKPGNIAYSLARGAVLLDFGLASGTYLHHNGGTPWYVPAEYADVDSQDAARGAPGDVWALGVTMLFVLGLTGLPELDEGGEWLIARVRDGEGGGGVDWQRMDKWLGKVKRWRGELAAAVEEKGQQKGVTERIVAHMLEPRPGKRITATEAVAELAREGVTPWRREETGA